MYFTAKLYTYAHKRAGSEWICAIAAVSFVQTRCWFCVTKSTQRVIFCCKRSTKPSARKVVTQVEDFEQFYKITWISWYVENSGADPIGNGGHVALTPISAVSEPAHLVAHQSTQHSIVVRPTDVRAISTDIIILPDDRSALPHLWLGTLCHGATCCVKLRLSLLSNPGLKLICFLLLSANYSIYLPVPPAPL